MRKFLKELVRKWKAETPIVAKCIRNIAGALSVGIPTAWLAVKALDAPIPTFLSDNVVIITFVSVLITAIAGLKEKRKNGKRK